MNKLTVISGEAPETDSEDEGTNIHKINRDKKEIKGTAVHGEDSESEDDADASVASVASTSSTSPKYEHDPNTKLPVFISLLHKKLIETNQKFQLGLNSWCDNIVNYNTNNIIETEQNLLQSQITLQGAVDSLRVIVNNTTRLRNKLDIVHQEQMLSNIKSN